MEWRQRLTHARASALLLRLVDNLFSFPALTVPIAQKALQKFSQVSCRLSNSWIAVALSFYFVACAQRGTPIEAPPEPTLLDNPAGTLPAKISQIGLFFDPVREIPSGRVIPYHVRYGLYSDDNDKSRYLFLPPGGRIDNSDPQQWQFPEGTLLFKTFYLTSMGGRNSSRRRIETRVLQRRAVGWQVGTYQWNADGSEAFLTDGNDIRFPFALPFGNYVYTIPGKLSCLVCHQPQPNFVIGLEVIRMSGLHDASGKLQMAEWVERNLFLYPEKIEPLEIPGPELEREALGYLHGNCAHCHNPGSPIFFSNNLDLRYWRAKETTINVMPQKFASSDSSIVRIKPGDPDKSLLVQLFAHTFPDTTIFMPPLGTSMIDTVGLQLIKSWIAGLR
ncbi:MAG: hypothetical protein ACREOO_17550 [bacterium]